MNSKNLQKLLNNYVEKYNILNQEGVETNELWEAVLHFKKSWKLDAKDFGDMFREAMEFKKSGIRSLLDEKINGIIALCSENGEMMESVREEFRRLLMDEEGSVQKKQESMERFLIHMNEMLDRAFPGKWKFYQNKSAIIFYMALIDPENNYIFLSEDARNYCLCVEYQEDYGVGQNFRLDFYFAMCEELSEILDSETWTKERLDKKYKFKGWKNLLIYDIMHKANEYSLYENITIRKGGRTGTTAKKLAEAAEVILTLKNEREQLDQDLSALQMEKNKIKVQDLTGIKVKNMRYGEGVVQKQDNFHITVKFKQEEKLFPVPDAVAKGFLRPEEKQIVLNYKKISEMLPKEDKLIREIRRITLELEKLED